MDIPNGGSTINYREYASFKAWARIVKTTGLSTFYAVDQRYRHRIDKVTDVSRNYRVASESGGHRSVAVSTI